jgi:dTDP-4-dehydrorhamnose reductase
MSILILGSSGKIGKNFIKNKKNYILTYNRNKITKGIKFNVEKNSINKLIKKFSIKKVVILSAISDLDACHLNKKKSYSVNVKSTKKIIDHLTAKKIYFIFFSSEMVYSGKNTYYDENSTTKPINTYGKQKLAVEKYIKKKSYNYSIFRVGKTYSDKNKNNDIFSSFFSEIKKKKFSFFAANDQKFSPIYVKDMIKITDYFLKKEIKGIFNVAGPKTYSRYQCLKILKNQLPKKLRKKVMINKIKIKDLKFIDKRPLNLLLKIEKLQKIYDFPIEPFEKVAKNFKKKLYEKCFN